MSLDLDSDPSSLTNAATDLLVAVRRSEALRYLTTPRLPRTRLLGQDEVILRIAQVAQDESTVVSELSDSLRGDSAARTGCTSALTVHVP